MLIASIDFPIYTNFEDKPACRSSAGSCRFYFQVAGESFCSYYESPRQVGRGEDGWMIPIPGCPLVSAMETGRVSE
jgi:hypothetical protein